MREAKGNEYKSNEMERYDDKNQRRKVAGTRKIIQEGIAGAQRANWDLAEEFASVI